MPKQEKGKSHSIRPVSRRPPSWCKYQPEEVVGKAPVDLMPLKEANRVARVFDTALSEKKPFAFVENVCLHKDGRKVVLETSGVPFFDASGNVRGFRGVDRDVTERKRAEEEAQESFRKLQRTVEGTIQAIALTVETRDPYTAGHQRRVTKLAYAIAREMGLPNDQIQRVRTAGLLHDLGKIFIPTEILSKPGQLSENEYGLIMPDQPVLCDERVRVVGDPVAMVAAETPESAEKAASLIRVDYEDLPGVLYQDKVLLQEIDGWQIILKLKSV
jgi:PAS domain S-box-containing protein